MALDSGTRSALLLFADRLEAKAQALPRWNPSSPELWHELVERQYEAELALAQELQILPGCQLAICSSRLQVRLELLGFGSERTGASLKPVSCGLKGCASA